MDWSHTELKIERAISTTEISTHICEIHLEHMAQVTSETAPLGCTRHLLHKATLLDWEMQQLY